MPYYHLQRLELRIGDIVGQFSADRPMSILRLLNLSLQNAM